MGFCNKGVVRANPPPPPVVVKYKKNTFSRPSLREGFRKKTKKNVDRVRTLGGRSGKIFAGPQFYCDFWKIKPRW